jgi:ribonuclease J
VRESEDLMDEARNIITESLYGCNHKNVTEWNYIRNVIRDDLKDFLWQKTKRNPMILPIIMEL